MELDLSKPWSLVIDLEDRGLMDSGRLSALLPGLAEARDPLEESARELARFFSAIAADASAQILKAGDGSEEGRLIIARVDGKAGSLGFAWRAAPERVEFHADCPAALLRAVYDFMEAAGFSWPYPGADGERKPSPASSLPLARLRGFSRPRTEACLILGHGSYLEATEDYLPWAARNGYARVFIHVTREALALGAAPLALYGSMAEGIAAEARKLGLRLELGGHLLSSLREGPESAPLGMAARKNPCSADTTLLARFALAFADFAQAHPEIEVFHIWPEDVPGEAWCSCPACATLSPAAQYLRTARVLASALAEARPEARLSFLAYHDTAELPVFENLPANLELCWAPRLRSWASGLGAESVALNAASLGAYRKAARSWKAAGGGPVSIFEYWEDEILFKLAVPPLPRVISEDLAAYLSAGESAAEAASPVCPQAAPAKAAGAAPAGFTAAAPASAAPASASAQPGAEPQKIGVLLTGSRLPLAPRPNPWLYPRELARLAEGRELLSGADAWIAATYGPAATPLKAYWETLEAAWRIDLELEPGESAVKPPESLWRMASDPPADWGDPFLASAERLETRRARSEELFDLLRAAEKALEEARALAADHGAEPWSRAVLQETREYAIASLRLELGQARIAAYHEAAAGEIRAAADIALIAQGMLAGLRPLLHSIPERRARRNLAFLARIFFGLRLAALRRGRSRNPLGRGLSEAASLLALGLSALRLARVWETRPGKRLEAAARARHPEASDRAEAIGRRRPVGF